MCGRRVLQSATQQSVTSTLGYLARSGYHDRVHLVFQVLVGHSLFGDGTLAFANPSFA